VVVVQAPFVVVQAAFLAIPFVVRQAAKTVDQTVDPMVNKMLGAKVVELV
jgi:hypothetical protein